MRIELVPEAANQVSVIAEWWTANRPAAAQLFAEELGRAIRVLERKSTRGRNV